MKLSRLERETGILWNEQGQVAVVWSVSKAVQRRMTKRFGNPSRTRGSAMEWDVSSVLRQAPIKPRQNGSGRLFRKIGAPVQAHAAV